MTIQEIEFNELKKVEPTDFWETEVVIFRNLFTDDFFLGVQHDLDARIAILEKKYNLKEQGRDYRVSALSRRMLRLIEKHRTLQQTLYDVMTANAEVTRCAINPLILKVMQLFLSEDLSLFHKQILLMSEPMETWHTAKWHQDHYYNGGPVSTLTTYIPLQNTGIKTGGLMLIPFKEKGERKILSHSDNDPKTRWDEIDEAEIRRMKGVEIPELQRGDMLVFSGAVPHSPNLNQSKDIRFVLNFRYRDLNAVDYLSKDWKIGDIKAASGMLKKSEN